MLFDTISRTLPAVGTTACVAAALFGLAQQALAQSSTDNTDSEPYRQVVDMTIDYSHGVSHFYEYYAADGSSRGGDGTGAHKIVGHWHVRPDQTVCFFHDDPNQSGCVFVQVKGRQIEFHRLDGVVEGPFTLLQGNPHGL